MTIEIVRSIASPDEKRRLEIFKRSNGTYGFEDMKNGEEESGWFPVGSYSIGIFSSEEEALNEAKERVQWLAAHQGPSR